MSEEIASQSEESVEEVFQDDSQEFDVREAFGLPAKVEKDEESEEGEPSVNDKTPAKEDVTPKRVVKFNKEDREIDESEVEGLLQKGLALDKERERKTELEKTLERVAKLDGVSVTDYLASLDKKETAALEKEKNAYDNLRKELREEAKDAGLDPDKLEAYLNEHPLMKEAQKAKTERDIELEARKVETEQQAVTSKWNELYAKYPDIVEDSNGFKTGDPVKFYTPEMQSRIERGYDPIDAYELSHRDQLTAQTKKKTEQQIIKQQQLSNRSKVADDGEQENRASEELKGAFALFGIDPKRAQKYAK